MANPTVLLETTSGDILIELYADKAPATVENFLKYVNEGFYANTIFHRVIKGFMIQGGGMNMKMEEKATHAPIKNEADNGLANERGTIAMARTRDPHSATAQFFINTVDNGFLNFSSPDLNGYGYCVFGKVIEGMEAVDKIEKEKTTTRGIHSDVPVSAVLITNASALRVRKKALSEESPKGQAGPSPSSPKIFNWWGGDAADCSFTFCPAHTVFWGSHFFRFQVTGLRGRRARTASRGCPSEPSTPEYADMTPPFPKRLSPRSPTFHLPPLLGYIHDSQA